MVLDFYSFGRLAYTLPCSLKMMHKYAQVTCSPSLAIGFVNGFCDLGWLGWEKNGLSHLLVYLWQNLDSNYYPHM